MPPALAEAPRCCDSRGTNVGRVSKRCHSHTHSLDADQAAFKPLRTQQADLGIGIARQISHYAVGLTEVERSRNAGLAKAYDGLRRDLSRRDTSRISETADHEGV